MKNIEMSLRRGCRAFRFFCTNKAWLDEQLDFLWLETADGRGRETGEWLPPYWPEDSGDDGVKNRVGASCPKSVRYVPKTAMDLDLVPNVESTVDID